MTTREDDGGDRAAVSAPRSPSDPAAPEPGDGLIGGIPPRVAGWSLREPLPTAGGEADLFVVENDGGRRAVLKLYRYGMAPRLEVLERWRDLGREAGPGLGPAAETSAAAGSSASFSPPDAGGLFVQLLDFGRDERGRRWFEVLEWVGGGTLARIAGDRRLDDAEIRWVLRQLLAMIERLHEADLLHLDLKPDNLLVRDPAGPRLALTDFGIATRLDPQFSLKATAARGTPLYRAPETLGGVCHQRSDWWSVGMILLELLGGAHPWAGLDPVAVHYQLTTRDPPIGDAIPLAWRPLLRLLLQRDPARRAGATEVRRWLAGEPLPDPRAAPGGIGNSGRGAEVRPPPAGADSGLDGGVGPTVMDLGAAGRCASPESGGVSGPHRPGSSAAHAAVGAGAAGPGGHEEPGPGGWPGDPTPGAMGGGQPSGGAAPGLERLLDELSALDGASSAAGARSQTAEWLASLLATGVLWAGWDSSLVFPVRLPIQFVYEIGHLVAGWLTGGRLAELVLSADRMVDIRMVGGWQWLVLSGGYLGGILLGPLLIGAAGRPAWRRRVLGGLAAVILAVSLWFGAGPAALAIGMLAALAWFAVGSTASESRVARVVTRTMGLVLTLFVWFDLRFDLLGSGGSQPDYRQIAMQAGLPWWLPAAIWAAIGLWLVGRLLPSPKE